MVIRSAAASLLAITAALSIGAYAQVPVPPSPPARAGQPVAGTPRTPWGDPDLQGVWNYGTMTPLERPAQWAGKETLTEAEAIAYEQQTIARRATADSPAGPDWWEPENNVLKNRRTSLVVDPPDGRIPPTTAEYQARLSARGRGGRGGGGRYDNPESLSLQDRCIAWISVGPPIQPSVQNNVLEVVQSPHAIVLHNEMIHNARIVYMDDRPRSPIRSWQGESRGRWEGDTLVVDTINFNGRLEFRGSGETLHLTERLTRTGPGTLDYRYTVNDATVWTRPWSVLLNMTRVNYPTYEFACHEGNAISVVGTLKGARLAEQEQNRTPAR